MSDYSDEDYRAHFQAMTPEDQANEVNEWLDRHRIEFTRRGLDPNAWTIAVLGHAIFTAQQLYGSGPATDWLVNYVNAVLQEGEPPEPPTKH